MYIYRDTPMMESIGREDYYIKTYSIISTDAGIKPLKIVEHQPAAEDDQVMMY